MASLGRVVQDQHLLGAHVLLNASKTVQVKGDVRLIRSKEFKTNYSLRFPRVTAVRFDKGARDTMTHQELLDDVNRKLARGASDLCWT